MQWVLYFLLLSSCGRRRNGDVCSSAGNIWLNQMYWERCSKDDFFQNCKAPCAISPFAPLSVTSRYKHELFGFVFEAHLGLQDQTSISALGWQIGSVLAWAPHHFLFANNCCLLSYAEMVQGSSHFGFLGLFGVFFPPLMAFYHRVQISDLLSLMLQQYSLLYQLACVLLRVMKDPGSRKMSLNFTCDGRV